MDCLLAVFFGLVQAGDDLFVSTAELLDGPMDAAQGFGVRHCGVLTFPGQVAQMLVDRLVRFANETERPCTLLCQVLTGTNLIIRRRCTRPGRGVLPGIRNLWMRLRSSGDDAGFIFAAGRCGLGCG